MKNKNVGFLILGIAVIIGIIITIFNLGLKSIVAQTCTHGPECSMYSTIAIQTWISVTIAGLIAVIGLFLILSKEDKEIVIKRIKTPAPLPAGKKKIDYSHLDKEEKAIMQEIEKNNSTIFQSDLVEKLGFSKVKVTRVLDRLEGKQLIERKRRGMTNIVILKQ